MAKVVGLPKLSPTMEEGTLVSWSKKEGDAVEVDDLLAEVETDKATMEFRSFDKGVLLKILVDEGETLAPDTPVAIMGEKGEDIASLLDGIDSGSVTAEDSANDGAQGAPETKGSPSPADSSTGDNGAATSNGTSVRMVDDDRVIASPLVRRLARERGLSLEGIRGSGPHGRVIKRDLSNTDGDGAFARGADSSAVARGADREVEDRVEKLSQMRKTIARRLTSSKQDVPHYYLTVDIDAGPLLSFRASMNEMLKERGEKVSVNDVIIKAVAMALRQSPKVNASFEGDKIRYHGRVDISIAVAMEEGLITPVVRGADRLGVLEISHAVRDLAARARDKKLKPEEYTDGTFSISNLGMFGIESFTAVINTPEAGILAVGGLRDELSLGDGGEVRSHKRMRMTMSCDHRVIDGAVGAEFLKVLTGMLERPATMLL